MNQLNKQTSYHKLLYKSIQKIYSKEKYNDIYFKIILGGPNFDPVRTNEGGSKLSFRTVYQSRDHELFEFKEE